MVDDVQLADLSFFLPSFFCPLPRLLLACCSLPPVEAEYTAKGSYEVSHISSKSTACGRRAQETDLDLSLSSELTSDIFPSLVALLPL